MFDLTPEWTLKIFLLIVITVLYVAVLFNFLNRRNRNRHRNKIFFEILTRGFKIKSISSLQDILHLHGGVYRSGNDEKHNKGLVALLERYLVILTMSREKPDFILECQQKIKSYIEVEKKGSPFTGLPDNERNILQDMSRYLEMDDKLAVEEKIREISNNIKVRYDIITQLKHQNRWSIPAAIMGFIINIVFAVLSFF